MNRSIYVVPNNLFVDQNRILVVITFPSHKANQCVFTQADLTVAGCRTIGNYITLADALACLYNRHLIDTGTLVGTHELNDMVLIQSAVVD